MMGDGHIDFAHLTAVRGRRRLPPATSRWRSSTPTCGRPTATPSSPRSPGATSSSWSRTCSTHRSPHHPHSEGQCTCPHRRTNPPLAAGALAVAAALTALILAAAPGAAAGRPTVRAQVAVVGPHARHWDPLTDAKWAFDGGEVVLTEPGTNPGGPRRPFEYAIVTKGPELTSVSIEAEVRDRRGGRGHQPRRDPDLELPVADALLLRAPVDGQHDLPAQRDLRGRRRRPAAHRRPVDRPVGAPPAIADADWHDVRVDYDAETGAIAVYVDGLDRAADDRHRHHLLRWPGRLRLVRQLRPRPRTSSVLGTPVTP